VAGQKLFGGISGVEVVQGGVPVLIGKQSLLAKIPPAPWISASSFVSNSIGNESAGSRVANQILLEVIIAKTVIRNINVSSKLSRILNEPYKFIAT
jgi:hypothetical protein